MYYFTVPMAMMDFIPVVFFAVAAALLQFDLYNKMNKGCFALFASGTINIFIAGFLKALWKLLYAANICDFQALNEMFLPVQSLGFLLAGLGVVLMLVSRSKKHMALAVAPPVFGGSFVFIMMMVMGLGAICSCLSVIAVKMKKKGAAVLFVLSFLCSMGMGAMSGQDATQAWVNWVEQSINCIGQCLLMCGVLILHRAGLKDYQK